VLVIIILVRSLVVIICKQNHIWRKTRRPSVLVHCHCMVDCASSKKVWEVWTICTMRPEIQLFLLILAVPAQYLISKWMTPQAADREYLTRRFVVFCLVGFINSNMSIHKQMASYAYIPVNRDMSPNSFSHRKPCKCVPANRRNNLCI